jgi:hypothetical protein
MTFAPGGARSEDGDPFATAESNVDGVERTPRMDTTDESGAKEKNPASA